MHNEKDLTEQFIARSDYPIWYYKQLEPIDISYVIMNLLKEKYVVEIKGNKYGLTFGVNKSDEIGSCIQYDECNPNILSSYNVIDQAFKEGIWYIISDKDTTKEFKSEYRIKVKIYKEQQLINDYKHILNAFIDEQDIPEINKINHKEYINSSNKRQLEKFIKQLFKKLE